MNASSPANLEWMNDPKEINIKYTQYIEYVSNFRYPKSGRGG